MAKWADQLIDKVGYNYDHTRIETVQCRPDLGDTVGEPVRLSRLQVIARIRAGTTYATIVKNKEGRWSFGSKVVIVTIGGEDFIKTTPDNTKKDNLENLPELGSLLGL